MRQPDLPPGLTRTGTRPPGLTRVAGRRYVLRQRVRQWGQPYQDSNTVRNPKGLLDRLVRAGGLEPPRVAPPGPKPGASAIPPRSHAGCCAGFGPRLTQLGGWGWIASY